MEAYKTKNKKNWHRPSCLSVGQNETDRSRRSGAVLIDWSGAVLIVPEVRKL